MLGDGDHGPPRMKPKNTLTLCNLENKFVFHKNYLYNFTANNNQQIKRRKASQGLIVKSAFFKTLYQ